MRNTVGVNNCTKATTLFWRPFSAFSNIPKHVLPYTSLHRHRSSVLKFQASISSITGYSRHSLLEFFIQLGLGFRFHFLIDLGFFWRLEICEQLRLLDSRQFGFITSFLLFDAFSSVLDAAVDDSFICLASAFAGFETTLFMDRIF
jgi:hypothetical protein